MSLKWLWIGNTADPTKSRGSVIDRINIGWNLYSIEKISQYFYERFFNFGAFIYGFALYTKKTHFLMKRKHEKKSRIN